MGDIIASRQILVSFARAIAAIRLFVARGGGCGPYNNGPDGPGPSDPPAAYSTGDDALNGDQEVAFNNSGDVNNEPIIISWSTSVSAPGSFGFNAPSTGPVYWIQRGVTNCAGDIAGAVLWAYSAAQYIVANGPKFGANAVRQAGIAIAAYQGSGLGVAAAAEFMSGLAATIPASSFLLVLGGIGVGALALYGLYHCLSEGH